MKIDQLRPCDHCGKAILPIFYVVRTSIALVDIKAMRSAIGLMDHFGGGRAGLALAQAMGPDADVVTIGGEKEEQLWAEFFVCQQCHVTPINLAEVEDRRQCAIDADKPSTKTTGTT